MILVEGPSELIFYNTLAKQIGIDLDRLNISILNVGGVGFIPYIDILNALSIHWIARTDNDITKVPNSDGKYTNFQVSIELLISYIIKRI